MEINPICDTLQTQPLVGWVKPTLKPRNYGQASTKKRGFHLPDGSLAAAVVAILMFALPHIARAQNCEKAFADLRWTLVESDSSWQLASDHAGVVLVDKECDEEFIKEWFATAGWSLSRELTQQADNIGPFGATDRSYLADRILIFCLPRGWLWRWVTNGCSAGVNVNLFQGRITDVSAGARI
jgi:hypothetical protein